VRFWPQLSDLSSIFSETEYNITLLLEVSVRRWLHYVFTKFGTDRSAVLVSTRSVFSKLSCRRDLRL